MLNFCDFFQVYVFTTNHHLKCHSFDVALLILLSVLTTLYGTMSFKTGYRCFKTE